MTESKTVKVLPLVFAMGVGLGLVACKTHERNAATSEWADLFDGRTFAGWRGLGLDSIPTAHWVIEDGAGLVAH